MFETSWHFHSFFHFGYHYPIIGAMEMISNWQLYLEYDCSRLIPSTSKICWRVLLTSRLAGCTMLPKPSESRRRFPAFFIRERWWCIIVCCPQMPLLILHRFRWPLRVSESLYTRISNTIFRKSCPNEFRSATVVKQRHLKVESGCHTSPGI